MLQYINPTFEIILACFGFLLEIGELKVYHPHLFREELFALHVHQRHVGAECSADVRQGEVEYGHEIDGVNLVLPLQSFLSLLGNGLAGIVDASVLEVGLCLVLHLYDEVFVVLVLAVEVVYQGSSVDGLRGDFLVEEGEVGNFPFPLQQVVEEVDDERLRDFLSEDALETDVGEGVCCSLLFSGQR